VLVLFWFFARHEGLERFQKVAIRLTVELIIRATLGEFLKILLSAFACDPYQGSEPGVGWAWAHELAKSGHEVCVLTKDHHREAVEAALRNETVPNLKFVFLRLPRVLHKIPGLGIYPYYYVWQLKAFLETKRWPTIRNFDCIHHITYGSYKTPFFLALLPLPAIFGPVGGAEVTPRSLLQGLSPLGRLQEQARYVANYLNLLNPLTRLAWRRSTLILLTTADTLEKVPLRYRWKCRILPAVTTPPVVGQVASRSAKRIGECRALFVGRFLEWKGLHLVIRAVALACETYPRIFLGIRGDGKRESALRKLVRDKKIDSNVEWIPRVSRRSQVLELYDNHDVLVFPSFHDSGGMVVLEALSRGIPVVCLDLGGPATFVDRSCGACLSTHGRSESEVVDSIAEELKRLANMSETESEALRKSARKRAREFNVGEVVGRAYEWFAEVKPASALLDEAATQTNRG
jgi:glycosyltransferase involved in cell wall biosynthesis